MDLMSFSSHMYIVRSAHITRHGTAIMNGERGPNCAHSAVTFDTTPAKIARTPL
jgi:hypothetical protein